MKIAYLIREGLEEIIASSYHELVTELEKTGHEITVLNETGSFGNSECVKINTRPRFINYPTGAFNKLLYSRAVKEKLKGLNPDLILASLPESLYFLDELKIPKAVVMHDDLKARMNFSPWFSEFRLKYGLIPIAEYLKLGVMIDNFFQLKSLHKAGGIVFLNKETEEDYRKNLNALTRTIPNGLNPNNFILDSKTKTEVKRIKELFPETIFLFMARLDLQKNPLIFVRAAEKVLEKSDAFFLIAGDGIMYKTVEREIQKRGLGERVKLLGWKNGTDKNALLHACNCFVLPSLFEPFGTALIEAMACSKPSIVSDVGGLKETVDEKTGIKVKPNNTNQLSEAMNTILYNTKEAREMGKNARRRIQKFYDWKFISKQYNEFFDELIEWKREK